MPRQVEIRWSRPCRWDARTGSLSAPQDAMSSGIYQLTRSWAGTESLLYIGIVWSDARTMLKRMAEHRETWLGTLRGINYRFGQVVPLRGLTRDRYLLETIEGALVYELQPPENTSKKTTYSMWADLVIDNGSDCGPLPRYIDTTTHL